MNEGSFYDEKSLFFGFCNCFLFKESVQSKIEIGKTLIEVADLVEPGLSLLRGTFQTLTID